MKKKTSKTPNKIPTFRIEVLTFIPGTSATRWKYFGIENSIESLMKLMETSNYHLRAFKCGEFREFVCANYSQIDSDSLNSYFYDHNLNEIPEEIPCNII